MIHKKYILLSACVVWVLSVTAQLQAQTKWIDASASLGLSSDMYSQSGGQPTTMPSSVQRATLRASVVLLEQIELPFEAYITNTQAGYNQPFNQFGINPRFGSWLTLHAGYFSMRMSDFTFGDARLLGGGAELTPKNFRFGVFYGYSREARNPDIPNFFVGEYKRRVMGMKMGYGDESGGSLSLNILHAQDDSTSIKRDSLTPTPQENLVTSLSFTIPMFENVIRLTGEVAAGAFTNNTQAQLIDSANRIEIQESLYNANISTQVDGAAKVGLMITPSNTWNVRFDAQWIGPGYVTLGYVQLQNDALDLTVTPSLRLFESKVFIRASIGRRTNNLRNTRLASTDRTIGSLNTSIQFTDQIGLDAMYSNFGMRSSHRNDTIRVENISQMYSFTPRANFQAFGGTNALSLTATFQQSEDKNQFTANATNNTTSSFALVHSLSFTSTLSFATSALYNKVLNSSFSTGITTLNETIGYSLFERLLSLSGTAGVNFISSANNSTQFMGRFSATFDLKAWGSFTAQIMNNNYNFDTVSKQPSYSELQGSLQYAVSF
ncbi:MAG: hypothetical protein K1X91_08000 [Bacteriodetes bacterium]|nr:hypothetical protein [Bacteroidota bacterium]